MATEQSNDRLMSYVLQSRAELELARGNAQQAVELAQQSIDHPHASTLCQATSLLVKAQALAETKAGDAVVSAAFWDAIAALEPHGRRRVARAYQSLFETNIARGRSKAANEAAQKALELLAPQIG